MPGRQNTCAESIHAYTFVLVGAAFLCLLDARRCRDLRPSVNEVKKVQAGIERLALPFLCCARGMTVTSEQKEKNKSLGSSRINVFKDLATVRCIICIVHICSIFFFLSIGIRVASNYLTSERLIPPLHGQARSF